MENGKTTKHERLTTWQKVGNASKHNEVNIYSQHLLIHLYKHWIITVQTNTKNK